MIKKLLVIPLLFVVAHSKAQTVENTSYTTSTGEKVLRLEIVLPVDLKTAWELFTVNEQLKRWIAPVAHIELKTGGYILTNYDKSKNINDSSSIKLDIVTWLERELMILKVNLNDGFPEEVRNHDEHLQEIIQFEKAGKNKTKIIASMTGWGKGAAWDKAYDFFVKGNTWTYQEMIKLFKK